MLLIFMLRPLFSLDVLTAAEIGVSHDCVFFLCFFYLFLFFLFLFISILFLF